MNKAFVKEPDQDGRMNCPACGSLGVPVGTGTLDQHLKPQSRTRLGESAWFCEFARCDVAYFDEFERQVAAEELQNGVYPKDPAAPICACFGFTLEDLEADVAEGTPTRIRALLEKSKSPAAACATRAADGRCCMREVQRLYFRLTADEDDSGT